MKKAIRQQGFTLVELGIALTLIAALIIGGFTLVRSIRKDAMMLEYSKTVAQVMKTASKYMASFRDTSAVNTQAFANFGGWDTAQLYDVDGKGRMAIRSKIPGAWEEVGYRTRNTGNALANENIVYRINNVPGNQCREVISELVKYPSVVTVYADKYSSVADQQPMPGSIYTTSISTVATGTVGDSSVSNSAIKFSLSEANIKVKCGFEKTWIMAVLLRD